MPIATTQCDAAAALECLFEDQIAEGEWGYICYALQDQVLLFRYWEWDDDTLERCRAYALHMHEASK